MRGLLLAAVGLGFSCKSPDRNFGASTGTCPPDGSPSDAGCPNLSTAIDDHSPTSKDDDAGGDGDTVRTDRLRDGGSASTDAGSPRPITSADAGNGRPSDPADAAPAANECSPGTRRILDCGRCGESEQTCTGDGQWAKPSECVNEGVCTPEERQLGEACEHCGVNARTCLADCTWGEWSCTEAGECEVGEIRVEKDSCAMCGEEKTRTRTCSESCTWEDWGDWSACMPITCAAGEMETEDQACGYCGQASRSRTCEDECGFSEWSEWGECVGSGPCEPGQSDAEERTCGMCGTQTRARSCAEDCEWTSWGAWSACTGEGACTAGQTESRYAADPCGNCGKRVQQRTCSDTCTWGDWSTGQCIEQGECAAGSTTTRHEDCGCSGTREVVRTCNDSCEWGSWEPGTCNGDTPESTYYADADSDGYGDPTRPTQACGGAPAGYVANDRDCCDQDANARPGQTAWFSSPTACGGYDYDCDDEETRDTRSPFNEERSCSVSSCQVTVVAGNSTPCGGQYAHEDCYNTSPNVCSPRVFAEVQTRGCR